MAVSLKCFVSYTNPNSTTVSTRSGSMAFSTPLSSASSFCSEPSPFRPYNYRVAVAGRCISLKGFGSRFALPHRPRSNNGSVTSFAASHEDSNSEIEVEGKSEFDIRAKESQEALKQTLESFKEQAVKMQIMSEEAYKLYSEKARVVLKDTSAQLSIQVEKARHDLSIIAREISEEGKEYLSTVADNSPEPVKDIVETFASSTNDLKEVSKVQDFYLGIPYGVFLSGGGFLSFMITGSISAIRFGVILGGILLALSISSLRSWKRGESFALALKGQAAVAGIIFLRDLRLLSQRPSFSSSFMTLISGTMVAFYLYRITLNGDQKKGPISGYGSEN
ncbi:PREDICTED: protein FATTY ACID EXPORT 3, chloroplastic-like isoform X2 [Nelumbo nucifera]|uniref:Protein FATTY ACID EXPORT 3, chloroplastic-like isoform X2 n=1 Tax=Nelumbo nucifera TaxID=4432 RepID=A0A1U8Q1T0_NELNU|nr:PREDICTED: protein FATTY ACID EXPORT 3, chloroplastic-like isoform X2 [Nelumbo nucifera]